MCRRCGVGEAETEEGKEGESEGASERASEERKTFTSTSFLIFVSPPPTSLLLLLQPPPHASIPVSLLLLQDHRLLQQVGHGLARLRPDRQPLLDRGRVEVGLFLEGVVKAEALERPSLAPVARVDGDEAVEGGLLAAEALEADGDLGLDEERGAGGDGRGGGAGGGLFFLFWFERSEAAAARGGRWRRGRERKERKEKKEKSRGGGCCCWRRVFPASACALVLSSPRLAAALAVSVTLNASPAWSFGSHGRLQRGAMEGAKTPWESPSSSPSPPAAPTTTTIARAAGALQGNAFSFHPYRRQENSDLELFEPKKSDIFQEAIRLRVSKTETTFPLG